MNRDLYWKIVKDNIDASLKNGLITKEQAAQLESECVKVYSKPKTKKGGKP